MLTPNRRSCLPHESLSSAGRIPSQLKQSADPRECSPRFPTVFGIHSLWPPCVTDPMNGLIHELLTSQNSAFIRAIEFFSMAKLNPGQYELTESAPRAAFFLAPKCRSTGSTSTIPQPPGRDRNDDCCVDSLPVCAPSSLEQDSGVCSGPTLPGSVRFDTELIRAGPVRDDHFGDSGGCSTGCNRSGLGA